MRSMSLVTSRDSPAREIANSAPTVPAALQALAAEAGFRFNGDDPWDIKVVDPRLYRRILTAGSLGFGDAYMDGWWECERLDQLFHRLLAIDVD